MAPDEIETQVSGIEMTDEEIDEMLTEQGHGVLSVTRNDSAYGVPISFGYDGERVFMHLLEFGGQSKKADFMETTDVACLTTYTVESRYKWQSVVVRGRLEEVPADEHEYADEILDENGWFPTLFPPTEPMSAIHRVELPVTGATGRKGQAYQD